MDIDKKYAPIALFTYCRPNHTKRTVEALLKNNESRYTDLVIFSDAPKNDKVCKGVEATRAYIKTIQGFKSLKIIERESNWGLANSLRDGITRIVNEYGRVIVVEDDIEAAPFFLAYMNDALDMYANESNVACIHAYTYPHKEKLPETFFIKGADCWGWATWKRAWDIFSFDAVALKNEIIKRKLQREFEFDYTYPYMGMLQDQIDGKVSSWAICWYASAFLNDMYTLYPNIPMAKQIGQDGVGATHSVATKVYDVQVNSSKLNLEKQIVEQSEEGEKAFKHFFMAHVLGRKAKILLPIKYFRDYLFGRR